jgi:beta-phosphoglucomutase family hydrolase
VADARPTTVGLPASVRAGLFDLDGVLTKTATVHDAAWTEMFDDFLRARADRTGGQFRPFDPDADYATYVDGKARADGVRSFLASRGITLPDGAPGDPPSAETVHGLGNRKNALLVERIRRHGVELYDGSVRYVKEARRAGLRTAVVSSSANTRDVLASTGIADLFDAVVDGTLVSERGLRGKPAPDSFLAGADAVGLSPAEAAVFEDAVAGVEAGRAGHFACVVGVDRVGHADALRAHGADLVVRDLEELLP